MSERSYWDQIRRRQVSRRSMLRAAGRAGVGAAGLALVGCGDDDDDGQQQAAPAAAQVQQQQQQQQAAPAQQQAMQQQEQQQAAVAQAQQEQAGPPRGGRMIMGDLHSFEDDVTLPYAIGDGRSTQPPDAGVWDWLMQRGDSLEPEARLAESWEQNGDLTATIVRLQPGLEFHNGKPLNAEAVKLSYEAMNYETTPNSQVRALAAAYLESIDVIDDVTVQFNHAQWPGPVIYDLITFAPIADAETIPALAAMEEINGSGPFKFDFDQWEPGATWVAVPHENGYLTPYLDSIEYRTIADEDTQVLALESGELDVTHIPATQFARLDALEHITTSVFPPLGYWVVGPTGTGLGGGHPANDDPRFRLALQKAIDRERLHEDIFEGIYPISNQMWLPTSPAYDPQYDIVHYDPEGARALLEEAGLVGTEIGIHYFEGQVPSGAPEIVQANFQAIGIDATIEVIDRALWIEYFLSGTMPGLYMASTGFFWMNPETLPNMNYQFRKDNALAFGNGSGPDHVEYNAIVSGFASQPTPAEREELFQRWNALYAEAPWLLPYSGLGHTAAYNNTRVGGFRYAQASAKLHKEDLWLIA